MVKEHILYYPKLCVRSDLQDEEVEVNLLNSSFEKVQTQGMIKRNYLYEYEVLPPQEAWTWLPIYS